MAKHNRYPRRVTPTKRKPTKLSLLSILTPRIIFDALDSFRVDCDYDRMCRSFDLSTDMMRLPMSTYDTYPQSERPRWGVLDPLPIPREVRYDDGGNLIA